MKTNLCQLAAALFVLACTPRTSAVILLEPIELLTLFEIEGIDFAFYSSSERITIHVEDTDDGFMGDVELRGQTEPRGDLRFLAISLVDPREQVPLEIDIRSLIGPPHEGLTFLESRPLPTDPPPPTARALEPFLEPLVFGFRFVSQMPDPETGGTRSEYRLERVDVPEPSSLALAAVGIGLCLRRARGAASLVLRHPVRRSAGVLSL